MIDSANPQANSQIISTQTEQTARTAIFSKLLFPASDPNSEYEDDETPYRTTPCQLNALWNQSSDSESIINSERRKQKSKNSIEKAKDLTISEEWRIEGDGGRRKGELEGRRYAYKTTDGHLLHKWKCKSKGEKYNNSKGDLQEGENTSQTSRFSCTSYNPKIPKQTLTIKAKGNSNNNYEQSRTYYSESLRNRTNNLGNNKFMESLNYNNSRSKRITLHPQVLDIIAVQPKRKMQKNYRSEYGLLGGATNNSTNSNANIMNFKTVSNNPRGKYAPKPHPVYLPKIIQNEYVEYADTDRTESKRESIGQRKQSEGIEKQPMDIKISSPTMSVKLSNTKVLEPKHYKWQNPILENRALSMNNYPETGEKDGKIIQDRSATEAIFCPSPKSPLTQKYPKKYKDKGGMKQSQSTFILTPNTIREIEGIIESTGNKSNTLNNFPHSRSFSIKNNLGIHTIKPTLPCKEKPNQLNTSKSLIIFPKIEDLNCPTSPKLNPKHQTSLILNNYENSDPKSCISSISNIGGNIANMKTMERKEIKYSQEKIRNLLMAAERTLANWFPYRKTNKILHSNRNISNNNISSTFAPAPQKVKTRRGSKVNCNNPTDIRSQEKLAMFGIPKKKKSSGILPMSEHVSKNSSPNKGSRYLSWNNKIWEKNTKSNMSLPKQLVPFLKENNEEILKKFRKNEF